MKKNIFYLRNVLKNVWLKNPYILYKRKIYTDKIRNEFDYRNEPSIICSTCVGGIIYHNLGLRFLSPTINLWIPNKDFVKFIMNLEEYLNSDLKLDNVELGYPIAKLKDITIHFNHYKTFEEATIKWEQRKNRINYENLYIIMGDNELTYDEIKQLDKVKCKKLVIFTAQEYPELKHTHQLKRYNKQKNVGLFALRDLDGFREFEKGFDYVSWLNNTEIYY